MRTGRSTVVMLALLTLATTFTACGKSDDTSSSGSASTGSLTLYTGRDEELMQPLIDQFSRAENIDVEVRYGNSAEMGAQLLEEGADTPADVFLSQEVGALGVLEQAQLLAPLPDRTVKLVDERYRPNAGNAWVGVTARSRVIVYNPDMVGDIPTGVLALTDPKYKGQIAWAPTNASFQSFITAFRVTRGESAARDWLEAMIANEPTAYEDNGNILEAVNNGDIAIGLINHYYWARLLRELGDNLTAKLVFPKGDDPGGLVNATAVGITKSGADNPASQEFVDYLLSEAGQRYFVENTFEYPLLAGVAQPKGVPPLDSLAGPKINLTDLESLQTTQALLTDLGLLT